MKSKCGVLALISSTAPALDNYRPGGKRMKPATDPDWAIERITIMYQLLSLAATSKHLARKKRLQFRCLFFLNVRLPGSVRNETTIAAKAHRRDLS